MELETLAILEALAILYLTKSNSSASSNWEFLISSY
jgi:hypothetical protein